jgi:hypothetical protein
MHDILANSMTNLAMRTVAVAALTNALFSNPTPSPPPPVLGLGTEGFQMVAFKTTCSSDDLKCPSGWWSSSRDSCGIPPFSVKYERTCQHVPEYYTVCLKGEHCSSMDIIICGGGQYMETSGTKVADRKCDWCPKGKRTTSDNARQCDCVDVLCPAGTERRGTCDADNAFTCEACAPGP